MAKRLQLRRGTTAETNTFTGAVGEVTVDTNKKTVVVHDGVTAGGFPVAAIANNDGTISLIKKDGTVITTIPASGLFNNTLTSTATGQALTAAQGKVLQDNKLDKTANAVSASKLATARTINGVSFDGTANITLPVFEKTFSSNGSFNLNNINLSGVHTEYVWQNAPVNGIGGVLAINYSPDWQTQLFFNTSSATPQIYARNFTSGATWGAWRSLAFTDSNISGNAASATKLQTARTIGGVPFDGSANIDLPLFGVGQTWKDLTASRVLGTTYTNTTGKPIVVCVRGYLPAGGGQTGKINGETVQSFSGYSSGLTSTVTLIVPPGGTYSVSGSKEAWWELN